MQAAWSLIAVALAVGSAAWTTGPWDGGAATVAVASDDEDDAADAVGPTVIHVAGRTNVNAAHWGYDTALGPGVPAARFWPLEGLRAIVVELDWDDPVQDLDVQLSAPYDCTDEVDLVRELAGQDGRGYWMDREGHLGAPDAVSTVIARGSELDAFASGCAERWTAGIRSKDANAQLEWRMAVSLFYDDEPLAGYTAF
ncbi:MAG: hypothetical protein ACPGQL_06880 [Thermoplasmatota archaeon]